MRVCVARREVEKVGKVGGVGLYLLLQHTILNEEGGELREDGRNGIGSQCAGGVEAEAAFVECGVVDEDIDSV